MGEYCRFSGLPEDRGESKTLRIYGSIESLYKEHEQSISEGRGKGKWVFGHSINYPLNVPSKECQSVVLAPFPF